MKSNVLVSSVRAGKTKKIAESVIADPSRVVVCSSEKIRDIYLKMGVPLKQTHIVTGEEVEAYLQKRQRECQQTPL